jgi:hypothetical protein
MVEVLFAESGPYLQVQAPVERILEVGLHDLTNLAKNDGAYYIQHYQMISTLLVLNIEPNTGKSPKPVAGVS